MKRLFIPVLSLFLFFSCMDESNQLTTFEMPGKVRSNGSHGGDAVHQKMAGMLGEMRVTKEGHAQCWVATDPVEMAGYADLLNGVLKNAENSTKTSTKKSGSEVSANINVAYISFTPQAQAAFQAAVDKWSTLVSSGVTINVLAIFTPLDEGVLGAAGSNFIIRDEPGLQRETWYGQALAEKLAGRDLIPGEFDIIAFFSSTFPNWYFGTDGNTPGESYDFRSVVLHELGHGLGFFGSASVDENGVGSLGFGTPFPTIYDRYAVTRPGEQLVKENKFPNPSLTLGDAFTGDQILFSGRNVINATQGDRAVLFTYPIWLQGSSYSHLDEFTYLAGSENALMTPAIGTGESYDGPGPITLAIFDDLGWNGKIIKPVQ